MAAKAKKQAPEVGPGYRAHVVTTIPQLEEVVDAYSGWGEIVFDVETVATREPRPGRKGSDIPALDERTNSVIWLALAMPGRVDAIPMGHPSIDGHPAPPQLERHEVLSALKPLFFDPERKKINHQVKFDVLSLAKYWGEIPPGPFYDTISLAHLVNENLREFGLAAVVKKYLDYSYAKLAKEGTPMDRFSFDAVARYVGLDAKLTQMIWAMLTARIRGSRIESVLDMESDVTEVLIWMRKHGALIDKPALTIFNDTVTTELEQVEKDIYTAAGRKFLITSTQQKAQLLYEELKLPVREHTPKGSPSTSEKALTPLARKHPVVPLLIRHADLSKMRSTFSEGLIPFIDEDGRIRTSFKQAGTKTGRFSSCVAGSTLLPTSRGVFRFDEYLPQSGDCVLSHKGVWRPVRRKIYKGREAMYRVELSTGTYLMCTAAHRLLTDTGWREVGEMQPGETVRSYVGEHELCQQRSERTGDFAGVSERRASDYLPDIQNSGDDVSQRALDYQQLFGPGEIAGGKGFALLTIENRGSEPHAGQEWLPSPQLHRGCVRRAWLFDAESRREVCLCAPAGDGRGAWGGTATPQYGCTPHRRRQNEQRPRQFGVGHEIGAPYAAHDVEWVDACITAIDYVGTMGVWDIEVAVDHSYLTHGFINHNSKPNLQQIPRQGEVEDSGRIRGMFIAPKGSVLVVGDYSQVEYRLAGHFAGPLVQKSKIIRAFRNEIDLHAMTASGLFEVPLDQVTKEQRQSGKTANFLLMFGGGIGRLMDGGYTKTVAKQMYDNFHSTYPEIRMYSEQTCREARGRSRPYVETILGRRRRLPELRLPDVEEFRAVRGYAERQAVNAVIQGSAAEICKMALVRAHRRIERRGALGSWHIVLTVHDEIMLEVPERHADEGIALLRDAMENVKVTLRVPLVADIHAGYNWAEAK